MRKTVFAILLLLTTTAALAQATPRVTFPNDYVPQSCAPDVTKVCTSFAKENFVSAAFTFLGLTLDSEWNETHWKEMTDTFLPMCRKQASCYTVQGAGFMFCDDTVIAEERQICAGKYAKGTRDYDQCQIWIETYALGIDSNNVAVWKAAQACAQEKGWPAKTQPPDVWMVPAKIPRDHKDYITIYALDRDTHLPVPGRVTIENQLLYAPTNPAGFLGTYYPFKWPIKFNRVPNPATGHSDVVAPMITVQGEGYPPVTMRMPYDVPALTVKMTPEKLKPGKNTVTIEAKDAETGKPVELRVMFGEQIAGDSNKPFTLTLPKGKHPDLWVTSLFDAYSDVVVVPAK